MMPHRTRLVFFFFFQNEDKKSMYCFLLFKGKLTPFKMLTLAQLELFTAILAGKMSNCLKHDLDMQAGSTKHI